MSEQALISQLWGKLKWSLSNQNNTLSNKGCLLCQQPIQIEFELSNLCQGCKHQNLRPVYPVIETENLKGYGLFKFSSQIKHLIYGAKFYHKKQSAHKLAQLLVESIETHYLSQPEFKNLTTEPTCIISIPEHLNKTEPSHHLEQISTAVAVSFNWRYKSQLLFWAKSIPQQHTMLNKKQRIENVKDAFLVNTQNKITEKNIIVIDDILTTGATLKEAIKTLKLNYPDKNIIGLTLSYVHLGE